MSMKVFAPQRVVGAEGPQGPQGKSGPEGPMGPQGKQGKEGPMGPAGKDGVDGKDGRDGRPGKAGARGLKGDRGAPGPTGPKGDKGDKGEPGQKGADGKSASGGSLIECEGKPKNSLGANGDFCISKTDLVLYKKAVGKWEAVAELGRSNVGIQGKPGTKIYTGTYTASTTNPPRARIDDLYIKTDSNELYKKASDGTWTLLLTFGSGGGSGFPILHFFSMSSDSPNTSDWAVNNLAPLEIDPTNTGLVIAAFAETAEEGRGYRLELPADAVSVTFTMTHRAKTAPASTKGVRPKLYWRSIPDNSAISSWSNTLLTALSIPTNAYYQTDTQTIDFSTLSWTAGTVMQLELTRVPSDSSDDLVGDWYLDLLKVEFA